MNIGILRISVLISDGSALALGRKKQTVRKDSLLTSAGIDTLRQLRICGIHGFDKLVQCLLLPINIGKHLTGFGILV